MAIETCPAFQFYEERFWRFVDKSPDCWLWTGALSGGGYGQFWIGKPIGAHRYAFRLAFGWLPSSGVVMHKCDTPRCVRPDHLLAGTQRDNVHDKIRKGRLRVPYGDAHWSRRLSMEQIGRAREMWNSGTFTQRKLADIFSVSPATMNRTIRQQAWEERHGD